MQKMKMKNKTSKKEKYIDNGHKIYDMDVDGLPKREKKQKIYLNRKERIAVIKAALATYFPVYLAVVACFIIAVLLVYLWLK